MAYPIFPTIKTPSSIIPQAEDIGTTTKMSDGFVVSRARYTKSRLCFTVEYRALSYEDKEKLDNFYINTIKGSSQIFTWTCNDPRSQHFGKSFNVRMIQTPEYRYIEPKYWDCQILLQEA